MPVTLKDVAKHAGVSYATVSRVLANKPNITPETRNRVLESVQQLGYRPNRIAQSLQAKRSSIIGIVITDIQYDFFPPLVRAVENLASQHNFAVFLCNTEENSKRESKYINLLIQERVAGAIIAPIGTDPDDVLRLQRAEIPVVLVDREIPGLAVDSVLIDNHKAAYRLINHLIQNGYNSIAAVVGNTTVTTARERLQGYKDALKAHNLPVNPEHILIGNPTMETGIHYTEQLLNSPALPDAIFASNHMLASGVYKAIRTAGLDIPRDVAVVAIDDPVWASFVQPTMTVISQPAHQLGVTAMQLLSERISSPDAPIQRVVLDGELIVRESSNPRQNTN